MPKMDVIGVSLLLVLSISGCSNTDHSREVRVDGFQGKFVINKTGTGVPLTSDEDALVYQVGVEKLRLFSGTGGKSIAIKFDRQNGLLIIAYCGGRIERVESSFSDAIAMSSENWKTVRTQVITSAGFKYGELSICV